MEDLIKNLEEYEEEKAKEEKQKHSGAVHQLLAHSYLFYLFMLVLGLLANTFLPKINIIKDSWSGPVGFLMLVAGSGLIYWAQKTSANFAKNRRSKERVYAEDFKHGPYVWSRNPTHIGLLLILTGFGFSINSIFLILSPMVAFLFTYFVFIKKEESILVERYQEEYLKYKNQVRTWF